ncbi:MAG: hypothetical protein HY717_16105 [Planctomycetes bacterium]|nr:hypothetical protein [Planctomycetota bacterium]
MQHHPFQKNFSGGVRGWFLALSIFIGILAAPLLAQTQPQAPGGAAPAAAPEAAATAANWTPDPGHTAWMLVSTALVLLMTPGLGLFYGGMVRSKNVLATMMHSFFAMGLIVSPICYFGVSVLKAKLGYDDSLDAFGIHGLGGTTGALCTGIFADGALAKNAGGVAGLIPGRDFTQLKAQIIATAATWVFAIVMTAVLVILLKKTIGIRVSEDEEISGLDLTQHGEVGYNMS